ncbi:MAG: DNA polymerase III subunit epsilon [Methylococcaceae bacterium]|nr:DNA polymerase III subunit epsilon [Methylococcaceae bacterium]
MSKSTVRQVVLDTETTGLNPQEGHRIIEIGCVELVNRRLTRNTFHVYINPDRVIDQGAIEVHGITNEFLQDKPRFEDIVDDYLAFTEGAELIIHNAPFDVGFLNHELALLKGAKLTVEDKSTIFDTLPFARKKYPGARASLDALCKRLGIDNSHRELHGALLDAEILAEVYLSMTGGQFSLLDFDEGSKEQKQQIVRLSADRPKLKVINCSDEELQAHQQRLEAIEKASGECLWNK